MSTAAGSREEMFQKPVQPYPHPPRCGEQSCINYAGGDPVPKETYWLCNDCSRNAPDAYELGRARRPQDYYSNVKPWGPQKRIEWTRSTNAGVLTAELLLDRASASRPVEGLKRK